MFVSQIKSIGTACEEIKDPSIHKINQLWHGLKRALFKIRLTGEIFSRNTRETRDRHAERGRVEKRNRLYSVDEVRRSCSGVDGFSSGRAGGPRCLIRF